MAPLASWRPLWRSREQRVAGAVVVVVMLAVGFVPLFGGPGYEQALATGLLVPSVAAIATALELSSVEAQAPLAAVGRGVLSGLFLAGLSFATALVQAARVGMCDLVGGAMSFALTALVGSVLGGVWGAAVAEGARGHVRRKLLLAGLAFGLPLASALVSFGRFYTSPMIFAFDPFVGYFSGTLYDTVVDAGTPLLTYRAGSLATLAFVAFAASVLRRTAESRLALVPLRDAPFARARVWLAMTALAASLAVTVSGPALGHWETSSTIARELGGQRAGERCDVVFPESLSEAESTLLAKDCDEQLAAVEKTLGARGPLRIRAFFFHDAAQKRRLMGAADTLIAKPWRHEVYVQLSPYPHPVLGHELAHVVAGSFGQGPFAIAGSVGGLWPDPGLIEGVAVAASPDEEELTDTQWVHAMLELGTVPAIKNVFSIGFLGVAASKSYTLAGGFVRFVMDAYGADVVRAWYGGGSLEALTGKSWDTLDHDFRAYAAATTLLPEATAFAKARFERAAVFGRKCPHVVDALRKKADTCKDDHEADRATAAYEDVLAHDPHDWGARYGLGVVNARYGDLALGTRTLDALAKGDDTPRTWRDRARDALADQALLAGDLGGARAEYETLAARSVDEDFGRTCEVKALAATDAVGRPAVMALLLGEPKRPADSIVAAARLGAWDAETKSPLAAYLVGRTLVNREWFAAAAPYLGRASRVSPETTVRIAREAIRLRAVVACAEGDAALRDEARALVVATDGPFATSSGRRAGALRFLDRCSVAPVSAGSAP